MESAKNLTLSFRRPMPRRSILPARLTLVERWFALTSGQAIRGSFDSVSVWSEQSLLGRLERQH